RFTYEVKTYETFETVEEVEEIVDEADVVIIRAREQEMQVDDKLIKTDITTTTTTTAQDEVVLEHIKKDVIITQTETEEKDIKEVIVHKETGKVEKPAVVKETSWFRRLAVGAGAVASGAGNAASGALTKVDGVWKRTVQVLTTRKAHVDSVAPIAKTSYVYYDDEVYDAVLVEKTTGVTYVTQLLFDSATTKYYVYIRWGETDYRLDGPHETVESAKAAFQVTYHEQF
ncbi:hypothetical protein BGX24_007661, partial [Mortierella sp. AD032]